MLHRAVFPERTRRFKTVIPEGQVEGTMPVRLLLVKSRVLSATRADQEGGRGPLMGLLAVVRRVREASWLH